MNMKHILFFVTLLFFVLGCKKYEAEYAVYCQFSPFFFGNERALFLANADGKVLKRIEIPEGANSVSDQFSLSGEDLPEHYDLHYVFVQQFEPGRRMVNIFSHLDVPNGASVFFVTSPGFPKFIRKAHIYINDVESFDSLDVVDSHAFDTEPQFSPAEKRVVYAPHVPVVQGLVLRLLANGESQFRYLYLPDSLVKDTISVSWQEFKPEDNFKEIELPDNQKAQLFEVSAISPDFQHYTTLVRGYNYFSSAPARFNHPEGLQEPVAYRIKVESDGSTYEKIFQPGEALRFESSDMTIGDIAVAGTGLTIRTSGQIDLLRANINTFEPGTYYGDAVFWQIDGKPGSFDHHTLPVFSEYYPDWYDQTAAFKKGWVTVLQYGEHDYPQIREGFPERLNEPFAVARSGYRSVGKFFY